MPKQFLSKKSSEAVYANELVAISFPLYYYLWRISGETFAQPGICNRATF